MADWSKIVACPECGAGNPCDGEVCVRCHAILQQVIVEAARRRMARAVETPAFERVTVAIPPEVADFMSDVWYRIEWHDETVEKGSDDSIQDPRIAPITGGVINAKAKYFSFRYTVSEDPLAWWFLSLFDNEIEDIAKRHVTTLDLWKCAKPNCRHLFTNKADAFCNCRGR